jgi:hypothetical protein
MAEPDETGYPGKNIHDREIKTGDKYKEAV